MGKPLARSDVDDLAQFIHARNVVCSRLLLERLAANHGAPSIELRPIQADPIETIIKNEKKDPPKIVPIIPPRNPEPDWWHTMWFGGLVDLEAPIRGEVPSIAFIQTVVGRAFGITRADITAGKRTHKYVLPRHIAMYLAKMMTPRSLPDIGRRFGGRDHTTVLHGIRKIGARCVSDPEFAISIAALKADIMR